MFLTYTLHYMNPTPTLLPPDVYLLPCPTLFKNHCYEDWEPDSQMKKESFAICSIKGNNILYTIYISF